ncbi:MAG: DUF2336 domain-containing protein [Rhodospirillales bacterium]
MLKWLFGRKQGGAVNRDLPSYEESRDIAASGSAEKRRWLASQQGLQPEFLYYFATDKDIGVRRAVASNPDTPLQADRILADDEIEEVRRELAAKICRLVPEIDPQASDTVAQMVMEIVEILASDKAAQVRRIIAEEIKQLADVPPKLIEKLARDAEAIVAAPVLEYSPLLNDRQLIEVIRSGVEGGALRAIARRKKLRASISRELMRIDDETVARELIANKSAEIDESELLIAGNMAETNEAIKESMIERDDLTVSTIRRIAAFLSSAVLERLAERYKKKLGADALNEIKREVQDRIMKGEADTKVLPGEESRGRAERLFGEGKLDEDTVVEAIDAGERMFVIHALALLTGLPWEKVRDILASKSAKSICSLAWKADFTAERALTLQMKVGKLQGKMLIRPASDGRYTLSDDDMEWYLDFFE